MKGLTLFDDGKLSVVVHVERSKDGAMTTRIEVSGKTLDELKAEGRAKWVWGVRLGRHLMYRATAGALGFTFVAALGAGPWIPTLYAMVLVAAGDLTLRRDLRGAQNA